MWYGKIRILGMSASIGTQNDVNPDLCEKMDNLSRRDYCYHHIFEFVPWFKDPNLCSMISNETIMNYECSFSRITNKTICRKLRDDCYTLLMYGLYGYSGSSYDSELCAKIEEAELRDGCYNYMAIEADNVDICESIAYGPRADLCIAMLTRNLSSCISIANMEYESHEDFEEYCYRVIARLKRDPSLCEKVDVGREGCYAGVAEITKNMSICNELEVLHTKEFCYIAFAIARKDHSICYKIQAQTMKDFCYGSIATSVMDPSLCEKISDGYQYNKNTCQKVISHLTRKSKT